MNTKGSRNLQNNIGKCLTVNEHLDLPPPQNLWVRKSIWQPTHATKAWYKADSSTSRAAAAIRIR